MIPGQGTYPGCGFDSWLGVYEKATKRCHWMRIKKKDYLKTLESKQTQAETGGNKTLARREEHRVSFVFSF